MSSNVHTLHWKSTGLVQAKVSEVLSLRGFSSRPIIGKLKAVTHRDPTSIRLSLFATSYLSCSSTVFPIFSFLCSLCMDHSLTRYYFRYEEATKLISSMHWQLRHPGGCCSAVTGTAVCQTIRRMARGLHSRYEPDIVYCIYYMLYML